jgi:CheY-like chemotaxis protein
MSKTLLLADDSVTIQKVVGISFANEDIVLVTVDNGDDAIAKARETRPDIVLADVVMPGKSGYEVCEALKADPELAHVPVLLLTGTFEAFDEGRATAAGADGHITKPFEAQALVDTVNGRLAQSATVEPAATPAATPSDDPFQFLEEGTGESDSLPATEAPRTTMIMGEDLGSSDEAFSFDPSEGSDEPVAAEVDPSAMTEANVSVMADDPANEHTKLVMGTDELANAETLPPADGDVASEPDSDPMAPGAGLFEDPAEDDSTRVVLGDATPDLPELETDAGDFGAPLDLDASDETMSGMDPIGIDPLADSGVGAEAVLDPEGADDYDVSSSDLGDSFAASQAPAIPAPPAVDLDEPEPFVPDALEDSDPGPFAMPTSTEVASAEPVFAAPFEAAPEPEESPFEMPEAAPEPAEPLLVAPEAEPEAMNVFEPVIDETPMAADPEPEAEPVFATAPVLSDIPSPDLSPIMREQLHEAIEKIAWEAFGDVAERIVQDALARVEEVAWDVIPKMAEALIQEEIRKMKGDS